MLLRDLWLNSKQIEVAKKVQTDYKNRIYSLLLWIEGESRNKIAENVLHHSYEVGEIMLRVSFSWEDFNERLQEKRYEAINCIREKDFNNLIMKNSDYVRLILSGKILLAYTLDFENICFIKPQDDLMIQEQVVLN